MLNPTKWKVNKEIKKITKEYELICEGYNAFYYQNKDKKANAALIVSEGIDRLFEQITTYREDLKADINDKCYSVLDYLYTDIDKNKAILEYRKFLKGEMNDPDKDYDTFKLINYFSDINQTIRLISFLDKADSYLYHTQHSLLDIKEMMLKELYESFGIKQSEEEQ